MRVVRARFFGEAYRERLRSTFGDRLGEVRLFGSFARGEANDRSDVNVLVLVDGLTSLEMLTAVGEATACGASAARGLSSLADYERHWDADDAVVAVAFAEVEPLIRRVVGLPEDGGWIQADG